MKGRFNLVTGTITGLGTQQFDVLCGFDRKDNSLRLRASQTYGTMLDLLVKADRFEAMNYPEKLKVSGSVDQLKANPSLTAGLEPTMLFDAIAIQDTLLTRLTQNEARISIRFTKKIYRIDILYPDKTTERYDMRPDDLLVARYTRYTRGFLRPAKPLFSIDYKSYRGGRNGAPVYPTAFVINATTGQIAITMTEVEINNALPPALFTMEPAPEGFKNQQL